MKYSIDQNKIITEFSKYLLNDEEKDKAVALVLRDALQYLKITYVNMSNRLYIICMFQEIFDIINPHYGNCFSAFDVDFELDEDGSFETYFFELKFMTDYEEFTKTHNTQLEEVPLYRKPVKITYAKK